MDSFDDFAVFIPLVVVSIDSIIIVIILANPSCEGRKAHPENGRQSCAPQSAIVVSSDGALLTTLNPR